MAQSTRSSSRQPLVPGQIALFAAAGLLAMCAVPAMAQSGSSDPSKDYLEGLKACQVITDNDQRLACFDAAVENIVDANEAGDVQLFDRDDVRQTRRSLFGFNIPKLDIFGGGDQEEDADELFQTTITSVSYRSSTTARFTTAEGAVWEMKNIPRRLRQIEPGDTVIFNEASLGFYFVRINGQIGIKGKRVE